MTKPLCHQHQNIQPLSIILTIISSETIMNNNKRCFIQYLWYSVYIIIEILEIMMKKFFISSWLMNHQLSTNLIWPLVIALDYILNIHYDLVIPHELPIMFFYLTQDTVYVLYILDVLLLPLSFLCLTTHSHFCALIERIKFLWV